MNSDRFRSSVVFGVLVLLAGCQPLAKPPEKSAPAGVAPQVTIDEVNAAQQAWCDALVAIGQAHAKGEDYQALAKQVINNAYDYQDGQVFFKPTLAFGPNSFRKTAAGALAYFVGGDPSFLEDKGFALKPWVKVRYDNAGEGNNGIQVHGDIGIAMGNVYLTGPDGAEIMVDKTFVFRKGTDGKLRLIVHKSALPFDPEN